MLDRSQAVVLAVLAVSATALYFGTSLVDDAIYKPLSATIYAGSGGGPRYQLVKLDADKWEVRRADNVVGHLQMIEADQFFGTLLFAVTEWASPVDGSLRAANGRFPLARVAHEQLSCSECPQFDNSLPVMWHVEAPR